MGLVTRSYESGRRSLIVAVALLACSASACRGKLLQKDDAAGTSAPTSTGVIPAAKVDSDVAFAGSYTKTTSVTMKNGRRVASATNTGQATLTVRGGKAVWAQTFVVRGKSQSVTQTYAYQSPDAKTVAGGFDLALTWLSIEGDTQQYSPDKNKPTIQARKQADGWQLGLLTTDNNGVTGGAEFK